jgi:hypothetical protein
MCKKVPYLGDATVPCTLVPLHALLVIIVYYMANTSEVANQMSSAVLVLVNGLNPT